MTTGEVNDQIDDGRYSAAVALWQKARCQDDARTVGSKSRGKLRQNAGVEARGRRRFGYCCTLIVRV
jgi:hypothetical protein